MKRTFAVLSASAAFIVLFVNLIVFLNDRYGSVGFASWYGNSWRGRKKASVEIYNPDRMTAAHRALPFGTKVIVTNLENGREVRVRINDRGPYRSGRIIDLSLGAARRIGMVEDGLARVRLRIIHD
jgi:rare lipoprotein A